MLVLQSLSEISFLLSESEVYSYSSENNNTRETSTPFLKKEKVKSNLSRTPTKNPGFNLSTGNNT